MNKSISEYEQCFGVAMAGEHDGEELGLDKQPRRTLQWR